MSNEKHPSSKAGHVGSQDEPKPARPPGDTSISQDLGETVDYASVPGEAAGDTAHAASAAKPPQQPATRERLGRYQVLRALGRGGFGAVYLAHDPELNRDVAIKVPLVGTTKEQIQGFLQEARNLAQLRHPGIVTVYDVGVHEGQCYVVSDYLKGTSLRDWLAANQPTWQQSVQIVAALADALAHAHANSTVHRDVKPDNVILIERLQPVLVDFGLAISDEVDTETQRGTVAGTPIYMSPEQAIGRAHRIDGRTDIYALGVILYEMLCGRLPFRTKNMRELLRQISDDEPQPPRQLVPHIPPELERICLKAMSKRQSDRYTTAADMARDLRSLLGAAVEVHAPSAPAAVRPREIASTVVPDSASIPQQTPSEIHRAREAERRQVTFLYCGCEVGGDEASSEWDPDEQHDMVLDFQRACEKVVERYDGTVIPTAGQERLICFGYPIGYEDAARRAVYSGLGILDELVPVNQQRAQQRQSPISAWIAVHTGKVVVGETVEGSTAETISMTGEGRNVVTKMEMFSESGAVIISRATHDLVQGFFDCESVGTHRLKGAPHPVEILKVLGKSEAASPIDVAQLAGLTPLVGRDREVDLLQDRWEEAKEGIAQVVLLTGEAGLGKSRLVHVVKEHVSMEQSQAGSSIIEWRCSPYYQNSGLYPAVEYFQRALHLDREDAARVKLEKLVEYLSRCNVGDLQEVVPLFADLLSIPLDGRFPPLELSPQRQREKTLDAIVDWIRDRAGRQPILLVLEDLHWVDPSTLELLKILVDQSASDCILALFTFRPEFEPPWRSWGHQTQIALNRLRKKQIVEMIQLKTGIKEVPPLVVEQIVERTGGIPLFVEEFAKVVQESGGIKRIGDDVELTASFTLKVIPATLQDLLMARLDRMDADREVIQTGATLGREFSFELIRAVSPLDEHVLESELNKLVKAEVLFARGRQPQAIYQFKHALIQDAAYQSLLKKRRQHLHNTIATVLETNFPEIAETEPELLAHHFTESGQNEQGVSYWLKAGQRAQQRSANTEAISHLNRGLQIVKSLDESLQRDQLELGLQTTLGPVLMAARGWAAPEVGTTIERARELCEKIGSVEDQFFVMWGLWGWRVLRADLDICDEIADDVMRLVQDSPAGRELMSEAHWIPGTTAYYRGDFASAVEQYEKGLALYDDQRARTYALKTGQNCGVMYQSHIALALWELGFPDQASQRAEEMMRFARATGHPFSLVMGLFFRRRIYQFCRLDEQVWQSVEEEYRLAHEQGFLFWEVHAILARGERLVRQGNLDEARRQLDQGLQMLQTTGCKLSVDHPYCCIAEAYLLAGQYADANEWLERGFDLVDNHNERCLESEFLRLKGELLRATGSESDADTCFLRSIQVARRQQAKSRELRSTMSLCRLRQNTRSGQDEARNMLSEVFEWFTEGFDTSDLVAAKALLEQLSADR